MKNSRSGYALVAFVFLPLCAAASPQLCENAARQAASEIGLPHDVLLAIALTETGRLTDGTMRPWPWAVNLDGQGYWFDTRDEALEFTRQALASGRSGFDLGCFQINWHWHGAHFNSPRALIDPLEGARYAARFLAGLAAEFGSWDAAAGAYHSRTPQLAARYRARFERLRAGLAGGDLPDEAPPALRQRVNTYPFLLASDHPSSAPASTSAASLASLFPGRAAAGPAFVPALQEPRP